MEQTVTDSLSEYWPIHDPLGIQAAYQLAVLDENNDDVGRDEFQGLSNVFQFLFPPQAIQIQRSIRGDIEKDIGGGSSTVIGGEGIGRISIQGFYGIGPQKDTNFPTIGKQVRDLLVQFFQAFLQASNERGRVGKPGLRMVFQMVGGRWSEPGLESYYVWPESFPVDSRSHARPNSWDWSASLKLLEPFSIPPPIDWSVIPSPSSIGDQATGLAAKLEALEGKIKRATALLQKAKDLRSNLLSIAQRVKSFASAVDEGIYEVTDLVRGSAQITQDILGSLDPAHFQNELETSIRMTMYEVRKTLGKANLVASNFRITGAISASFSSARSASLSRPVSLGLNVGDSLQALAAKHLGSADQWIQIVKVNNLEYPYLDFSGINGVPGTAYASRRVLGAMDTLKLPLPASTGLAGVAADPIGRDLPDAPVAAGQLVGGAENMTAAVLRRLRTPKGRIPWHPSYGSLLKRKIGTALDVSRAKDIRDEYVACTKSDPRVLDLRNVSVVISSGLVECNGTLYSPIGLVQFEPRFYVPAAPIE